jgi:hypothetical protein
MSSKLRVRDVDILELLEQAMAMPIRGTANSDVNVFANPMELPRAVVERAIKEIKWLRTLAGAVTPGDTFVELRNQAKEPVLRVHSAYDVTYGDRQVVGFTGDTKNGD